MNETLSPIHLTDAYRIGVEPIDAEHRYLIGLYNGLVGGVKSGDTTASLEAAVAELFRYADFHFTNEEKLMAEVEFPGAALHRRQHESFVRTLTDLMADRRNGDDATLRMVALFVGQWIRSHILVSDKEIGEFVADRAAGGVLTDA